MNPNYDDIPLYEPLPKGWFVPRLILMVNRHNVNSRQYKMGSGLRNPHAMSKTRGIRQKNLPMAKGWR